jgi:hypothetical protein
MLDIWNKGQSGAPQDMVVTGDSAKFMIPYQYLDMTNDLGELC